MPWRSAMWATCLIAACATTTVDGLAPHDRAPSTYWRALLGTGVPLETALSQYGDDLLRFLEREALNVRAALARGAGPFLSELAHALDLDAASLSDLGERLRRGRSTIDSPLSEPGPFTPERARRLSHALRSAVAP
jgi:hypothetical protein